MRILNIVSDSAEPSASIHHVHFNIEQQLRALDVAVDTLLLTGKPHRRFGESLEPDFDVLRRPRKHPLRYWLLRRALRKIILEKPYDWIILDGLRSANIVMGIDSSLPASLRYLMVIHGRVKLLKPKLSALSRRLRRHHMSDWKLVAVSSDSADYLVQQLPLEKHAQISVIENCIDGELIRSMLLSREEARAELQCAESACVFGTIGRMSPEKDYATMVRAFAQLDAPRAMLVLVGDGKERSSLVRLAGELGVSDRVIFAGYKERGMRYLAAIDCFVMSSTTEGSPIALLEAFAAGKPVICSRIPPLLSALPEDYPYVFEVADAAQLSAQMKSFIEAGDVEKRRLGAELQVLSETRFSPSTFGSQYKKILCST